jgi:hypothetical protein
LQREGSVGIIEVDRGNVELHLLIRLCSSAWPRQLKRLRSR